MTHHSLPFAGCTTEIQVEEHRLCLVGLPSDSQSSYRKGAAGAPPVIRQAFNGDCYNSTSDSGVDLTGAVADLGNLAPGVSWDQTMQTYQSRACELFAAGRIPFFLGGDHAVTIPVVAALEVLEMAVHVVQLDAHADLYPEYEGDPYSHACTASRLLEMPHVKSLTVLGVRTLNPVQTQAATAWGERLRIVEARHLRQPMAQNVECSPDAPVYLTLDLDALDPAFAPGVAHPVPGGPTPRQLLDFVDAIPGRLVGMDAVEVNPSLDVNHLTSIAAGRLLQQGMAKAFQQLQHSATTDD